MNKNYLTFVGAMLGSALAGSLVTSWLGDTTSHAAAQDAAGNAPAPAAVYAPPGGVSLPVYRYQMVALGEQAFGILDTRTGRCWTGTTHRNSLSSYGLPPNAEK